MMMLIEIHTHQGEFYTVVQAPRNQNNFVVKELLWFGKYYVKGIMGEKGTEINKKPKSMC